MLPLYQALERRDYQTAIDECDHLIESFPQYKAIILKIKAESLNHSQQYSAAKQLYLTLLKEDNQDWVKVALANTLVKNNEVDQAKGLLNTLKNKKSNPYYFDEMSNISLVDDDVPAAISHLKRSTMLLEAGADRELIIANLSMAVSAYKDAFLFMGRYYDNNKNTYRGNIDTRINYLRYFLFQFFDKHNQSTFEHQLISMMPILKELNQRKDLNLQNALVSAHIHLLRGEIHQAITRLASVFPRLDTLGFYDLYHLLALLERCSMLKEIKIVNQRCRDKIKAERNLSLYRTQVYMLSNFESALEQKQQTVTNIKYHIEQLKQFGSARLNDIIDLHAAS
ncbi:tetratricopeptide repeat protein [Vibrio olivae]